MPYSSQYATCAGREIHYTEWGSQHATAVIAWHGLARTGRDMDELAEHLSSRYRVICPDTIGRGLSQWSPDPHNEYLLAFYARLAAELFDHLNIDAAHWVGTSMGGAIGMVCAGGLAQHRQALDTHAEIIGQRRLGRIAGMDTATQTEQVLKNLQAILRAGGSDLQYVLRCGVFLIDMKDFAAMNGVYARMFGEHRPARTTIQAVALPDPKLRVEIDCVAYVP